MGLKERAWKSGPERAGLKERAWKSGPGKVGLEKWAWKSGPGKVGLEKEKSLFYTVFPECNIITRRAVLYNDDDRGLRIRKLMSMMLDL
ncbi:MAG: glycoside hydrolase family 36 N-terminal domain-containing protein, partial [Methanosarcinaceae archaeon]|nr:glycoside hydrolase family 36 N-terminal domain-containing protein [Methanosarcinaceae archaeon]